MIKISILYPTNQDSQFDMAYYLKIHMPMAIERLSAGPGFRGVSVERGLTGSIPDSMPNYVAMCHYLFDSLENFMESFGSHAETLQGDMLNYTDIEPIIQISEVVIHQ